MGFGPKNSILMTQICSDSSLRALIRRGSIFIFSAVVSSLLGLKLTPSVPSQCQASAKSLHNPAY